MKHDLYLAGNLSFLQKIPLLNKSIFLLSLMIVLIGTIMLYGSAGGNFVPWAGAHLTRYAIGIFLCISISVMPINIIYKPAYFVHIIAILLLLATEIFGDTSKGAQRWLDLGFLRLQPSELAKITTILALSRFLHEGYRFRLQPITIILIALTIIFIPAIFVLKQPDLGTALLLIFVGVTVMFAAGIDWKLFAGGITLTLASLPIIWMFMHDYQKRRVFTFLNPESDPLGDGYHISQAKIAMGSGGFGGRGYMNGPQSMLEFLPEKHTDFAFTAFAEQFGFVGSMTLLILFMLLIISILIMSLKAKHIFGKLVIIGIATNLFFYVFINMAMVMGLMPVVGVPLPFISYGGTVMMTIMIGFGIAQNALISDNPISDDYR